METLNELLQKPEYLHLLDLDNSNYCHFHQDKSAKFVCEFCSNYYCDECPQTIGELENCCRFCQVVCKSVDSNKNEAIAPQRVATEENDQVKSLDLEKNPTSNLSEIIQQNERPKKGSIVLSFLSALFLSGSIAYFWVYEISPRLEKKEDENSQSVTLNKQQKSEKSNEANISAVPAAKNESVANSTDERCIDPQSNQPFVCDEETKRTLYEQTRKTKSVAEAKKQVEGKTNTILSLILPSASPSPENANQESQNPVDEARKENDKRLFIEIFIGSFILIFGFLVIPRFFRKE